MLCLGNKWIAKALLKDKKVFKKILKKFKKSVDILQQMMYIKQVDRTWHKPNESRQRTRDHSSAGRAPALQAGGHRFEPCWSHSHESEFHGNKFIWRDSSVG